MTEYALQVPCYSIEEILAEKIRSLIQRSYTTSRNFYDIRYLSKHFPGSHNKQDRERSEQSLYNHRRWMLFVTAQPNGIMSLANN